MAGEQDTGTMMSESEMDDLNAQAGQSVVQNPALAGSKNTPGTNKAAFGENPGGQGVPANRTDQPNTGDIPDSYIVTGSFPTSAGSSPEGV